MGQGEPDPEAEAATEEGGATPPFDFSALQQVAPYLDVEANEDPPVVALEFDVATDQIDSMDLSGQVSGRGFSWRGVPIRSLSTTVDFDPVEKIAHFPTFQLGYGEGMVTGEFQLDTENLVLTIISMQSSIDPIAFATDWGADWAAKLEGLEMVDAPLLRGSGTVPIQSPMQANLSIGYDHRRGFSYRTEERVLPITDLRGSFKFTEGRAESDDFSATIFGGTFSMNGVANFDRDPIPFSGLIELAEMSLTEIGQYFGSEDLNLSGDVYLDFRGVGYTELSQVRGGGTLRIDDAALAGFPVIGQVQALLGQIIPAFGLVGEGSVEGAYLVDSGMLITNDLRVAQAGAEIETMANLKLDAMEVDFTSTAQLQQALAAATGLTEKQIVVKGNGPLASPNLRLDAFPADFAAENLGEILGTSPETISNLGGVLKSREEASRVLGEAAQDLLGDKLEEMIEGAAEDAAEGAEGAAEEAVEGAVREAVAEPVGEAVREAVAEPVAEPVGNVLRAIPAGAGEGDSDESE